MSRLSAMRHHIDTFDRRLAYLRGQADLLPEDAPARSYVLAEIAALAWALPILRAEAAAAGQDDEARVRFRRLYGVAYVPTAVEPFVTARAATS